VGNQEDFFAPDRHKLNLNCIENRQLAAHHIQASRLLPYFICEGGGEAV
jgi:hypothetical protein